MTILLTDPFTDLQAQYQGYSDLYQNIYANPNSGPTSGQILLATLNAEANVATLGYVGLWEATYQAADTGDYNALQDNFGQMLVGASLYRGSQALSPGAATAATGTTAANTGARFIVSEGGTVVHASQAEMRASLEGAGFTGTPTRSPGMAYELPSGVTARAMAPLGENGWRTSFNNASGTYVTPEGAIPQPPRGFNPTGWRERWGQLTHIEQRP